MQLKNVSSVTPPWLWGLYSPTATVTSLWKHTQNQYNTGYAMSPATQTTQLTGGTRGNTQALRDTHLHDTSFWSLFLHLNFLSSPEKAHKPFKQNQVKGRGGLFCYLQGSRRELQVFVNEIISYLSVRTGWFRRLTPVLHRSLHCWCNTSKLHTRLFLLFHTPASPHQRPLQVIFPACKAQVSLQVHLLVNSPAMGRISAEAIHSSGRDRLIRGSTTNLPKQHRDQHWWNPKWPPPGNLLSKVCSSETRPHVVGSTGSGPTSA